MAPAGRLGLILAAAALGADALAPTATCSTTELPIVHSPVVCMPFASDGALDSPGI